MTSKIIRNVLIFGIALVGLMSTHRATAQDQTRDALQKALAKEYPGLKNITIEKVGLVKPGDARDGHEIYKTSNELYIDHDPCHPAKEVYMFVMPYDLQNLDPTKCNGYNYSMLHVTQKGK
jgi:hypothetical protein